MSKTTKDTGKTLKASEPELTEAEAAAVLAVREKRRSHVRAPDLRLDFDEGKRSLTVGHKGKEPLAAAGFKVITTMTVWGREVAKHTISTKAMCLPRYGYATTATVRSMQMLTLTDPMMQTKVHLRIYFPIISLPPFISTHFIRCQFNLKDLN